MPTTTTDITPDCAQVPAGIHYRADDNNDANLSRADLDYLRDRAVDIDLAVAEGLYGIEADIPKDEDYEFCSSILSKYKIGRIYSPRLVVPYSCPLDGVERVRARNHDTRVFIEGELLVDGKHHAPGTDVQYPRWLAGKGVSSIPYIPLALKTEKGRKASVAEDASVPIFVTEAPIKALSLVSHGFFAIGMAGVEAGAIDTARSLKRKGVFLPQQELGKISWRGRVVYITYDSGIYINPAVARGAARLAAVLKNEGADVRLVLLPLMRLEDIQREMSELGLTDDKLTEILEGASPGSGGPSHENIDADTGKPVLHAKESGDEGPDDFLARQHRYAKYLKHGDPKAYAARAFQRLVDDAVPADAGKWVKTVIDAEGNKADRVSAVQSLLEMLPFQALVAVGGETSVGAVSALTQSLGFGKKAIAEAVGKFESRVQAMTNAGNAEWKKDLQRSPKTGALLPSLINARLFISNDPALRDVFRFDLFLGEVTVGGIPPWAKTEIKRRPVEDADVIELRTYLQKEGCAPSKDDLWDAVIVESRHQPIHPLRDYLLSLKWDGVERLDRWLTTYLGVEETDYTRLVGPWWMQQAVDRIFDPGCQADYTLVFEGLQGLQKTSTCRTLAVKDEWFRASPLDISNKDAYGLLSGSWIYELGEGAILRRADMRLMKQFLTERWDKWRPAYMRAFTTQPRQVCFVMTTNDTEYLIDDTGNRRYWPVQCGTVKLDDLRRDIDQLWAEAVHRAQAKARRWPTPEEEARLFRPEQEKRHEAHIWTEKIANWLESKAVVSASDVLEDCLKIPADKVKGTAGREAKSVLERLGWKPVKEHGVIRYHRPAAADPVKLPSQVEAVAVNLRQHGYQVTHTGVEGQYVLTVTRWPDLTDDLCE